MEKKGVIDSLKEKFSEQIQDILIQFGDEIILIDGKALPDIAKFLKEDPYSFTILLDLTCVDYAGKEFRFEMVYHFYSLIHNIRLRLKARLPGKDHGLLQDGLGSLLDWASGSDRRLGTV